MRFILCVILWFVLVGGVYGYVEVRDNSRETTTQQQPQLTSAIGEYALSITPTFSMEKDPFALTSDSDSATGFELWLNGKRITVDESGLRQGSELRIEKVQGFNNGGNEVYVKASPPISGGVDNYAVRVRLIENDSVIKQKTIWSSGGAQVSGTMTVVLGKEEKDEH